MSTLSFSYSSVVQKGLLYFVALDPTLKEFYQLGQETKLNVKKIGSVKQIYVQNPRQPKFYGIWATGDIDSDKVKALRVEILRQFQLPTDGTRQVGKAVPFRYDVIIDSSAIKTVAKA